MDLFDYMRETKMESEAPLASSTLSEKTNYFTERSRQIS